MPFRHCLGDNTIKACTAPRNWRAPQPLMHNGDSRTAASTIQ
jgi:hypothetical protein